MPTLLSQLAARHDLTSGQATELFHTLVAAETSDQDRVSLLAALRDKGETPTEVAAFAHAMRAAAKDPGITPAGTPILDVVGTGGDGASTLNISTAAALLAAATAADRIRVVKHGNRAISSRSGASDVLTALGLPAAMDPPAARTLLERTGFTYLHAPHYHPSVAAVAAARRQLGSRSIFNLLGPLTNPARPHIALIGAYSPRAAALLAHAMSQLEYRSATVVHTPTAPDSGLDEATTAAAFTEFLVEPGAVVQRPCTAADYRISRTCTMEQLKGQDAAYNAQVIRDIFNGRDHPAKDTILLNTGLALRHAFPGDAGACAEMAAGALRDGRASNLIRQLESFGREHAHAA